MIAIIGGALYLAFVACALEHFLGLEGETLLIATLAVGFGCLGLLELVQGDAALRPPSGERAARHTAQERRRADEQRAREAAQAGRRPEPLGMTPADVRARRRQRRHERAVRRGHW